jgi:hypothetical protein
MNFITQDDNGSDDDSQKRVVSNLPFTPYASHPNSTPTSTANGDLSSYAIQSAANLKDNEDDESAGAAVANLKDDGIAGSLQGLEDTTPRKARWSSDFGPPTPPGLHRLLTLDDPPKGSSFSPYEAIVRVKWVNEATYKEGMK